MLVMTFLWFFNTIFRCPVGNNGIRFNRTKEEASSSIMCIMNTDKT